MRIRITGEDDEFALTELQSWLSQDPGTAGLSVKPVTGPGPTMGALEALDIILGNGTDLANFALAYATWRATKRRGTGGAEEGNGARVLTRGNTTVDIGHLSPDELADLLHRLDDGDAHDGTSA
jgi:hypothetical protein